MQLEKLKALLATGPVVVRFKPEIENMETCLEVGMLAQLTGVKDTGDGCVELVFNQKAFTGHNRQFERSDYFDKNGRPVLTAREAGQYSDIEQVWSDLRTDGTLPYLQDLLDIVSQDEVAQLTGSEAIYAKYLELRTDEAQPYQAWLESVAKAHFAM